MDVLEGDAVSEQWRPIPGYEDLYSVSDLGRVRREGGGSGARPGRIVTPVLGRQGYYVVQLWRHSKRFPTTVHALVAAAFIGSRPAGAYVNHIDGQKRNNRVVNLEYVTPGENSAHAYRTGLRVASSSLKTHCPKGHPYDETNTYIDPAGTRQCRACRRERARADREAKRK